ncbi:ribosome recycling factor [Schistosoma japonicum]|nr:ribosome recycling factor [Schistosoma japonicum]
MNRLLSFHKLGNFSFNIFNLLVWKRVMLSPVFSFNSIVHSTVRWKSKGGHAVNAKKVNRSDISPEVLSLLKEDKMNKEFHNVMSHFQSSLIQRLNLRMTPQLFSDILLPDENVKLGHVANLILQNTAHHNMSLNYSQNRMNLGDQCLLIDLTGRPDLFVSARKAVTTFLNPCKDGSEESRIQSNLVKKLYFKVSLCSNCTFDNVIFKLFINFTLVNPIISAENLLLTVIYHCQFSESHRNCY